MTYGLAMKMCTLYLDVFGLLGRMIFLLLSIGSAHMYIVCSTKVLEFGKQDTRI